MTAGASSFAAPENSGVLLSFASRSDISFSVKVKVPQAHVLNWKDYPDKSVYSSENWFFQAGLSYPSFLEDL